MTGTLTGLKVLLIEDEQLIAMDIEAEVEDEGGEVIEICLTRKDAVLAAADGVFDGAIVDLNLRDGNSLEVGKILLNRGIPFVFATGDRGSLVDDTWTNVPVFSKPGKSRDLVKMLSEHIKAAQLSPSV